jgi:putative redox protein
MNETAITAQWVGPDLQYIGTDSKGNSIKMGGDDISPAQMVLLGLAGCMGMDTVYVLRKKRLTVESVQVTVIGHQPDDHPKPFTDVEIHFTISGKNLPEKAVERAINLSRDKYCVVGQTLTNPVNIQTSFVIITPEDAPVSPA